MSCVHAFFPRHAGPVLRLVSFLGGAALMLAATSAPASDEYRGHPDPVRYRVINLAPGGFVLNTVMNRRGQAAFSVSTSDFLGGYFYDGRTTRQLPTFGGPANFVTAINDAGQVGGYASLADQSRSHGYVWSSRSGLLDLGTPSAASNSVAEALNNKGELAGSWFDATGAAFRWRPGHGFEDLGTGPYARSGATLLNDAGLVAGTGFPGLTAVLAFTWCPEAGYVDIATLGGPSTRLRGITADGRIGGSSELASGLSHAFIWDVQHGMRDLGTAGGGASAESYGSAMSADGYQVGFILSSTDADGTREGFSWTHAAGMRRIGKLGGANSVALAVNNMGQVVGWADGAAGQVAVSWSGRDGLVDLNTRLRQPPPGLVLDAALAVSDTGAIVASSNAGIVLLDPASGGSGHIAAGPMTAPDVVAAGAPVVASFGFAGEAMAGPQAVGWNWGDGSGKSATWVTAPGNSAQASAAHRYAAPGSYTVTARVGDAVSSRTIIVYEPALPITGGQGSFTAPRVAGRNDGQPERAAFSFFAAPANAGAKSVSTGRLRYQQGRMDFRSDDVTQLNVAGQQAHLTGTGQLNGIGKYRFTLLARTGNAGAAAAAGRFGLKVWHADPKTGAEVVDVDTMADGAGAPVARGDMLLQN